MTFMFEKEKLNISLSKIILPFLNVQNDENIFIPVVGERMKKYHFFRKKSEIVFFKFHILKKKSVFRTNRVEFFLTRNL